MSIASVKDYFNSDSFNQIVMVASKKNIKELLSSGWKIATLCAVANALVLDDNNEIKAEYIKKFTRFGHDGYKVLSLLSDSSFLDIIESDTLYHYLLKGDYSIPITLLAVFERLSKDELNVILDKYKDKTDIEIIEYLSNGKIKLEEDYDLLKLFRGFASPYLGISYYPLSWGSINKVINVINNSEVSSPLNKERTYLSQNKTSKLNI